MISFLTLANGHYFKKSFQNLLCDALSGSLSFSAFSEVDPAYRPALFFVLVPDRRERAVLPQTTLGAFYRPRPVWFLPVAKSQFLCVWRFLVSAAV